MSFLAAAGLGVSLYSAVTSKNSADSANSLSAQALELQREQFQFAKEQDARWKSLYGPLEENLSEFYSKLTPDYVRTQGLEAYEKDFTRQQQNLTEFYAQNGIESGVVADLQTKSELQGARDKAKIRADAPNQSADLQSKFLALGITQKPGVNAGVASASANLSAGLNRNAAIAGQYSQDAGAAFGQGLSTFATEIDKYMNKPPVPTANQGTSEIDDGWRQ